MKSNFFRFPGLWMALAASVLAALPVAAFTPQERAQGYREDRILAKPRADLRELSAELEREGMRIRRTFPRFGNLQVIELGAGDSPDRAIARLRATGRYEYVVPDRIVRPLAAPDDSSFNQQWSLNNTGQNGGVSGADIRALSAWDNLSDASTIRVAVIDSGIRIAHEDFAGSLWSNSRGTPGIDATVSTSSPSYYTPTDASGHGSHVSGIIGAAGNNRRGIAGVAWRTQIMALKFIPDDDGGSTGDEIECIEYAIANEADVINASFGGAGHDPAVFDAMRAARNAGIIIVCAAGNDGTDNDSVPGYPASYLLDNIVTVAATTRSDTLWSVSNYGSGSVDLAAPGVEIFSTWNGSNTDYRTASGTSMAAPHVSGAIALLKAKFPSDNYRQTINRLLRSTTKLSSLEGKVQTGGRLNLAQALALDPAMNRPFNDDFAERALLRGANIRVRASNAGATDQTETGEPEHAGVSNSRSLWWAWTPSESTQVSFDTSGSSYDTVLAVYTGSSVHSLAPVGANDDTSTGVTSSRLVLNVAAGTTYQIAVSSKTISSGLTLLAIGSVPGNNDFASARTVTGTSVKLTGTTLNASRESNEPAISGTAGRSVWYAWTAPTSGRYHAAAFATQIDTVVGVYTGSALGSLTLVASNDNSAAMNSDALVPFNTTAGTTYYVLVDHTSRDGSQGGEFILTLTDSAWEFPAYDEITSSPAVGPDGTIYFGAGSTNGNDPAIYAVTSNGTRKWRFAIGGEGIIGGSPAIGSNGTVYIGGKDDKLYALDGATGALKWSYTSGSPIYSAPALATNGTIYFRDETKLFALTDNGTGVALKWSYTLNTAAAAGTYCSPVVGLDGTVYVGTTDGTFYALADQGGSAVAKWTYTADGDIYTTPAIAADGTIYFGTLEGSFYALTPGASSATLKWTVKLPAFSGGTSSISSSPALAPDGTIYFAAYDHKLHALNPQNGSTKWTFTLGNEVRASSPAVAADGTVFIGVYDGLVYGVRSNGTLLRTFPSALLVRSSPVLAGNRLYFGSNDAKLHAFDIGQSAADSAWPMFQHDARHTGRAQPALAITQQPQSQTVAAGATVSLSVTAAGESGLSYQWFRDGAAIPGATGTTFTITSLSAATAGFYTVAIASATGTTISAPALVRIPPDSPRIVNISTRAYCNVGDRVAIGGFVIRGTQPKRVLVRAVGPTLATHGINAADVLADPTITVFQGAAAIATNDNWANATDANLIPVVSASIGASPFAVSDRTSSAVLLTLDPGVYTFVASGNNGASGIVLVEVYDADSAPTDSVFVNISTRAYASTGDRVAIGGFVISGSPGKNVLIRAVGPTLTTQGIGETEVLTDPAIMVHGKDGALLTADDWSTSTDAAALVTTGARVGATPFASFDQTSAAAMLSLSPGPYTVVASGKDNAQGIVLVEIYDTD